MRRPGGVSDTAGDPSGETAERYRRFAAHQAAEVSPLYAALSEGVSRSARILAFLAELPPSRRQPNLLLAAARLVAGQAPDIGALEAAIESQGPRIRAVMLSRTTQTNEPARCAALLPALSLLAPPGGPPLALIEVGASAGLCLTPDRYGYDYGRDHPSIAPRDPAAPVLSCAVDGPAPIPVAAPEIAWRRGLDLNPLDAHDAEDARWLETLIWPGQEERAERLRAALRLAAAAPVEMVRGDLLRDLPALAATAPGSARLVVFHTAVLTYVRDQADRDAFAERVRGLGAVWLSCEAPQVFPNIASMAPPPPAGGLRLLLAINGTPLAWVGPHGQSLSWFAEPPYAFPWT